MTPPGAGEGSAELGRIGMLVFMASLAMLFGASLAGYLVIAARAGAWPPPGMPGLPAGLAVSTALLLGASAVLHAAGRAAEADRQPALRRALAAALALGVGFLVMQGVNWWILVGGRLTPTVNLYGFTFYLLTGLHAVHVVGGLVPLAVTLRRAGRGRYGPGAHTGVTLTAMYWHFLDGVWLVLLAVLLLTT